MHKITPTEVTILHSVNRGRTSQKKMSEELHLSQSHLSTVANRIVKKGFLSKHRHGATIDYRLSDRKFNESVKRLFSANLQFERLLANSALPLLIALATHTMASSSNAVDQGMTASQLLKFSGLSRDTLYRTIKNLMASGAIYVNHKRYFLSGGMPDLVRFVREYTDYLGTMDLQMIIKELQVDTNGVSLESNTIKLYQAGGDVIFSVPQGVQLKSDERITPTGISAFCNDGLAFQTSKDYYHYSMAERSLRIEDYALDQFLIEPHTIQNVAYTMLYLLRMVKEIDWQYLLEMSCIFCCRETFEMMKDYLEALPEQTREFDKPFPTMKEFKGLCKLYEVKI